MSLWSVMAIGIGSMVGAGIFALLGQAALMVGRDTWLAFAIGGGIALLAGYAYAGLSARYPSDGGIVDFYNLVLPRWLAGALSVLFLLNLGISTTMIAKTFGAYSVKLGGGEGANLIGSVAVVALYLLTIVGQRAVGRVEIVLVAVKLLILLSFLVGGLWFLDLDLHRTHQRAPAHTLIASVGLTFFAYAGFGMMANAAGNVANPARTMRIAFPLAILVTCLLYVGLSVVVVGAIQPADLAASADTAVATAARPYFGAAGVTILSLAALLATASAINANIYSGNEMIRSLSSARQLPAGLGRSLAGASSRGVAVGVAAVLVMTNVFDLVTVANAAGAVFLFVYLAVYWVAWRKRTDTGAVGAVLLCGALLMGGVFVAFLVSMWNTQPAALGTFIGAVIFSILLQAILKMRSVPPVQ